MASKITIEFIDDIESANMALNAQSYYASLWEIRNYLRSVEKYEELTDEVHTKVEEIQNRILEIIRERGIDL